MIRLLHFQGEGRGFYSGITEYIILADDPEVSTGDHCAPGFELKSETELTADLPHSLPFDTTLIPRP